MPRSRFCGACARRTWWNRPRPRWPSRPQSKAQLLAVLRALKKQTPRYDKSRGLATLDFDPFASGVPEAADDLHLPTEGDLKLTGLGDDLSKVVAQAIKLLEAGDMTVLSSDSSPPRKLPGCDRPNNWRRSFSNSRILPSCSLPCWPTSNGCRLSSPS